MRSLLKASSLVILLLLPIAAFADKGGDSSSGGDERGYLADVATINPDGTLQIVCQNGSFYSVVEARVFLKGYENDAETLKLLAARFCVND